MTPELKTACEVVFQEHKLSDHPVKWDRDAFRGKISIGLSEMAKLTLVSKNIILSDKQKKIFTQLNPFVAAADSFEEAEKMIETKTPTTEITFANGVARSDPVNCLSLKKEEKVVEIVETPSPVASVYNLLPVANIAASGMAGTKWYMKPIYLYVIWPLCGAAGGVLVSFLMNFIFTELFK